jgi:hypothetical protein
MEELDMQQAVWNYREHACVAEYLLRGSNTKSEMWPNLTPPG